MRSAPTAKTPSGVGVGVQRREVASPPRDDRRHGSPSSQTGQGGPVRPGRLRRRDGRAARLRSSAVAYPVPAASRRTPVPMKATARHTPLRAARSKRNSLATLTAARTRPTRRASPESFARVRPWARSHRAAPIQVSVARAWPATNPARSSPSCCPTSRPADTLSVALTASPPTQRTGMASARTCSGRRPPAAAQPRTTRSRAKTALSSNARGGPVVGLRGAGR